MIPPEGFRREHPAVAGECPPSPSPNHSLPSISHPFRRIPSRAHIETTLLLDISPAAEAAITENAKSFFR